MLKSQSLQLEQSTKRQRINELLGKDEMTAEERTELGTITQRAQEIEVEYRAAVVAEDVALEDAKGEAGEPDAEKRERIELRSKATLTGYLTAAARGRMVDGAEAELCAAAGVQGIPLELWDVPGRPAEQRSEGAEHRAITPAPGTTGVNFDPIRPAVFATSIAARLGIEMPRVSSGTYATGTVTTSQGASALAKQGAIAGTAGAITVTTATPKRVSARLELTLEDIAAIGQANFESILRQNLAPALSDELDEQAITGDGNAPNLTGILQRLTDPGAPGAGVADFDDFIAAFAGGVDGLWANQANEVGIVVNPESYRRFLHTALRPMARIVEAELRVKLDAPDLVLDLSPLAAADVAGRARSFKAFVESGMDPEDAARETGVTLTKPLREPKPAEPPEPPARDDDDE